MIDLRWLRWSYRAAVAGLLSEVAATAMAAQTMGPPATNETPVGYRLDLTIDPATTRFTAHTEVDFRLRHPSRIIHLNGQELDVTHVEARVGNRTIAAAYRQLDADGHVKVTLAERLPKGQALLAFDYSAPLLEGPSGIFHAQANGEWFASTETELTQARRVFPSFDQINFKTPYTVSITAPRGMTALSAMPQISLESQGDLERHVFAPSPPLPSYLISFAAGPFVSVSGTVPPNAERNQPLPIRIFAPREAAPKLEYTLAQSIRIVVLLEDFLGVAFPYPKIDLIGSPIMKGGVDNAGAAVFSDDQLFPGPDAPPRTLQFFGILVVHELALQWLGDYVTPLWWSDVWLKESLAHWTALTLTPRWLPGVSTATSFSGGFGGMDPDSLPISRAMHTPLDEATQNLGYTGAHGKGTQLLSMISAYIGKDRTRAGITEYLRAHSHGSAAAADFFAALGRAAKSPEIAEAMRGFTDQPGVPLVEIRRGDNAMIVSQRRYAPLGVAVQPEVWTIPFCYRVGDQRDCTMLKQTSRIELLSDAEIMPNAGGHGYYRFNLSDADWNKLIRKAGQLSVGEAIALNDSVWAGFRGGYVPAQRLVEVLPRLAANPSPDVALDGADRWMKLEDAGLIPRAALPAYRKMLSNIYGPMLNRVGFDPAADRYDHEKLARRQLRIQLANVLALGARQSEVVDEINRATDRFLTGDSQALDPGLLRMALQVRVRTGGRQAAEAILERAVASEDGSFRPTAVLALGSSGDPETATWLLGKLEHSGLRPPDKMDLVETLLRYSNTQKAAIEWLRSNYSPLAALRIGRVWTASMASSLCSEADAAEIQQIMRPSAPKDTSEGDALDEALQKVKTCAAVRDARSGELARALAAAY